MVKTGSATACLLLFRKQIGWGTLQLERRVLWLPRSGMSTHSSCGNRKEQIGKKLGGRTDQMVGGRKRMSRDCGSGGYWRRLGDKTREEDRGRSQSILHVMLRRLNFILEATGSHWKVLSLGVICILERSL